MMRESPGVVVTPSRTALVVASDRPLREALTAPLRGAGYGVVQRERGGDAIQAARSLQPALIALEADLPDGDGWSVLREIRSAPHMQRVPALVIASPTGARADVASGPIAHLHKTVKRVDLVDAIQRLAPEAREPIRVLLVDDDALTGEMVGAMLPPPRFAYCAVSNATRAVDRLRVDRPDLLLLDLVMPGVSGFELLQSLRADPRLCALPVLVLTAKHLTPQEQIDLSQAAQVVLARAAVTPEQLLEKVHQAERISALVGRLAASAYPLEEGIDAAQFRDDFLLEAREQLASLEDGLAQGERLADAPWIVPAVRAAHTLKANAGMLGHVRLATLAEHAENLLRRVMDGRASVDADCLSRLGALHGDMGRLVADL